MLVAHARHESGEALKPVLDALLDWGKVHAVALDDPDRRRHYRSMTKSKDKR
jgi:DNA-binding HxlR family transcriptional regulator